MRYNTFRGYGEEELEKMALEDFLPLAKSRARRAIIRALEGKNFKYKHLIEKVRKKIKAQGKKGLVIKTHVRDAVIIPEWLGITFKVHNGKEFVDVKITREKLGHRLGEWAHTTKPVKHSGPGIGATRGSRFVAAK